MLNLTRTALERLRALIREHPDDPVVRIAVRDVTRATAFRFPLPWRRRPVTMTRWKRLTSHGGIGPGQRASHQRNDRGLPGTWGFSRPSPGGRVGTHHAQPQPARMLKRSPAWEDTGRSPARARAQTCRLIRRGAHLAGSTYRKGSASPTRMTAASPDGLLSIPVSA